MTDAETEPDFTEMTESEHTETHTATYTELHYSENEVADEGVDGVKDRHTGNRNRGIYSPIYFEGHQQFRFSVVTAA